MIHRAGQSRAVRWRAGAALAVIAVLALVAALCGSQSGKGEAAVPASLGWGVTHTQYSAADGTSASLVDTALASLSARSLPQNQHLMGWGADNPEPSPGRYDFGALDARIELIRKTGGTPVITLCCAPDWMKGGTPGRTDWSRRSLETAPSPEHYDDFAALAAKVAERYPDVRHFVVWNEFKGFFDDGRQRWNHEGYTQLYNKVHRALKKVDERILVGGPYLNMDSFPPGHTRYASALSGPWGTVDQRVLDAFTYWNEHKVGADFVVVDGSSYARGGVARPDEFGATRKFTAVGRWIGRQTSLPLWWAEYYTEPGEETGARRAWTEPHRLAVETAGMMAIAKGGAETAFFWNAQRRDGRCVSCLWPRAGAAQGAAGDGLPMMALVQRFAAEFPPGTAYRPVELAGPDASAVLALGDDGATLVVNTLDRPARVTVDGRSAGLGGYEVRWLDGGG
ncbi:xylan 1,4-beta-xylosidase [Streptomyces sp. NPDC000983]|uniref:GH39 family glycosyl hydrolase n=1 Tax=Streptomyces sp. NPDC000983 TaxID=3154373 RepID=UPI00332D8109